MEGFAGETFYGFFLSGALGALIGLERAVHHRVEREVTDLGGVRTFTLAAWFGWLCTTLEAAGLPAVGLLTVALISVAVWVVTERFERRHGITTELAYLVVWSLGAWVGEGAYLEPSMAAVAVLTVLGLKAPIGRVVSRLGPHDLYATIQFLLLAVVVLPLLPDRVVDPWGLWNPRQIGWLMVLISTLGFGGYLLARFLGPGRSLLLVAAIGGLVSSTAVTFSYSAASRNESAAMARLRGVGIALACITMLPRLLLLLAVVAPPVASAVSVPMLLATVVGGVAAWMHVRRHRLEGSQGAAELRVANPYSLFEVGRLTALFAVIVGGVRLAQRLWGAEGVLVTAALAGIADVDAISISLAVAASADELPAVLATTGILIAVLANTVSKALLIVGVGQRAVWRAALLPLAFSAVPILAWLLATAT